MDLLGCGYRTEPTDAKNHALDIGHLGYQPLFEMNTATVCQAPPLDLLGYSPLLWQSQALIENDPTPKYSRGDVSPRANSRSRPLRHLNKRPTKH